MLLTSLMMLAFAITSFAQCEAKKITLSNGTATLSEKTGSCQRFAFDISEGQRVKLSLSSTDGNARFALQNGAEDDTGTTGWDNLSTFDDVPDSTYWEVGVTGTSTTAYTLKITVSDE